MVKWERAGSSVFVLYPPGGLDTHQKLRTTTWQTSDPLYLLFCRSDLGFWRAETKKHQGLYGIMQTGNKANLWSRPQCPWSWVAEWIAVFVHEEYSPWTQCWWEWNVEVIKTGMTPPIFWAPLHLQLSRGNSLSWQSFPLCGLPSQLHVTAAAQRSHHSHLRIWDQGRMGAIFLEVHWKSLISPDWVTWPSLS